MIQYFHLFRYLPLFCTTQLQLKAFSPVSGLLLLLHVLLSSTAQLLALYLYFSLPPSLSVNMECQEAQKVW